MKRRTVHKITPAKESSFDQQFWPVLVALTVLSGIALGAVLAILHGPWMWGTLLALPLLGAAAIFLLFNLDNNRLRRSLQFAIITSLALHLLILVFASIINIFQNPFQPNERQVAQRRVRTIEISDQQASFVWEETNARETPEPKVETERQTKPSTNVQPQPVPVRETKPEINPQLVRRETTAESVPRQNRELSQLRRQTRELQPQSSIKVTGEKVAENKAAPASSTAEQKVESSKTADNVARQSKPQQESQVEPAKASAANDSPTKQQIARTSSSPRRATPAEKPVEAAPKPSPSDARVRKPTPSLPVASKRAPVSEPIAKATTTQPIQAEPSKSANQVTRRPTESTKVRPALTNRPKTELSPRPQVARMAERRTESQAQPSISTETSLTITPRRSTTESQIAASPVNVENPSRAPESKTSSRDLNSKTLSVSRSTEGVAGVGRSQNLDRMIGGMTSPASQASDSARRERTQSAPNDARMLTSSRSSDARRSVGAIRVPTSAFKSETSAAAKISGAKTPGERTLESSAAKIDSASTNHRDEISAEKGNSGVDMGPTKVVSDRPSRRRSGGGQPEVSRLNPESTRRSKDQSNQQPTLVAATGFDVAAPRNLSSAPPSTNALEASKESSFAARAGGETAITTERATAQIDGDISNEGQSDLAQQLADSRQRARRNENDSSWDDSEDDEEEENKRGTGRTRVAQAPVTRADPGFGSAREEGLSQAKSDKGLAPSESDSANVARQSTAMTPGSGLSRTAANVLLQAATSLPVIDASPTRRTGNADAKAADPDFNSGLASNPNKRISRSTKPSVAPTMSGTTSSVPSTNSNPARSADMAKLDSVAVSVSKSDLATMEQIQGSRLDILAVEGPAGLGDRPDTYIGVMTRPASRDSTQIQPDLENRFRSSRFGGTPAINPDAVIAREAFRNRSPSAIASASEPTTEAAIHLGLEFLARYQSPDGSWALTGFDRNERLYKMQLDSDAAATGLALLAFQGAGYNHREFKYARQIDHAIQWLIENQSADGGLYVPSDNKSDAACRLYSHGIATLALTEAYGMTQDARLREPAQKALDYIKESQDPRKGGWRYFDEPGKKSSDTSVSGWMMMALQSGRLAGLSVDEENFGSIEDWLDVAADPDDPSRYRYNPYAVDSKGVSRIQGRKPTASMTSVGLLMRIYSGWDRQDPRLLRGAQYLVQNENLPSDSTPQLRDTYYWYYATQVLKFVDGPQWETWNDKLRPLLTRSQEKSGDYAGSWHPYKPVPDRWGSFGGRLYVTSMNLLSLEVRHRMLPLYRQGDDLPETTGIIESIPEKVSTITPITSQPIDKPDQPEAITGSVESNVGKTNFKKPDRTSKPTVVKRPVIEPPSSTEKVSANDPALKAMRPPSLPTESETRPENLQPNLTRSVKSAAPTMTKPLVVLPMTTDSPLVDASSNAAESEVTKTTESNNSGMTPSSAPTIARPGSSETAIDIDTVKKEIRRPSLPDGSISRLDPRQPDLARSVKSVLPTMTQPVVESSRNADPNTGETTPNVVEANPTLDKTSPAETDPGLPEMKPAVVPGEFEPSIVGSPERTEKPTSQFVSTSGRVTLDGQVLKNAKVEFYPIDRNGIRISVRTNKLGRFNISAAGTARQPGIKIAKYKVSVTTYFESPDEEVIDFLELVPAKYNSKTVLVATISRDKKNNFDLKLTTK